MKAVWNVIGKAVLVVSLTGLRAGAQPRWTVHEWGTFTSLQDEQGNAIGGINTDDEPVPLFVHRMGNPAVPSPSEVPPTVSKGAPVCDRDVTVRLETPVVYFHLPAGQTNLLTASVHVKFRGGWLTEFFPDATLQMPGLKNGHFHFGLMDSCTESELRWDNLRIGGNWPITETAAHVWTAPRAVESALVRTEKGESEKYLFYRGLAHIDAPLRISRENGELVFRSQLKDLNPARLLTLRWAWLVDIRQDGTLAFRSLPPLTLDRDSGKVLAHTAASFRGDYFDPANRRKLRASLHQALVAEGLFADEADALLNTWELSYFKSAGLRVFFMVPRPWTDFYLPIEISPAPAELNRVMVGRIELVTPGQRSLLREIAGLAPVNVEKEAAWLALHYIRSVPKGGSPDTTRDFLQMERGEKPLASFVDVPAGYRTYLELGRFRNALLLDEAQRRPTPGLNTFISAYHLQGCDPTARLSAAAN